MKSRIYPAVVLGLLGVTVQAEGMDEVTVQSGRLAQKQLDAPASVRAIDGEAIRNAGAQVNVSEVLMQVPGVVALNRNNYAQDVQISIRGFGARSAFGLRGIRLITDGIPATTPDGQGQASTVSLTSAERIEILTGPLAQLYGNAAGGVIQTTTREAGSQPQLDASTTVGSYGLRRHDVQFSGRTGQVGIVADYSTLAIDGYRHNSAAERKQFNGVLTTQLQEDTRLKLVANLFDMPLAQDPLGLKLSEWQLDPRRAGNNAEVDRTRKSVTQNQLGGVLEHRFSDTLQMQWRLYTGTRSNLQYQARTSVVGPGWVGLERDFQGVGAQLKGKAQNLAQGPVDWVIGFDLDHSVERRQSGDAVNGEKSGDLKRNEQNKASNNDAYGQVNWHWTDAQGRNPYTLTAGMRHSQVRLANVDDLPLVDGNGTGHVRYSATTPVLGMTWHAADQLNVYANWGKGFETPTLAEAAYTVDNNVVKGIFNTNLLASRSQHSEAGLKWAWAPTSRIDANVFRITTENELVTLKSAGGKTAFKNATRTLREGSELSVQHDWSAQWRSQLSVAWLRAVYDADFTSGTTPVPQGKRMPGIPQRQGFASVQWAEQGFMTPGKARPLGWSASADWWARSAFWANDLNDADARVAGGGQLNLRVRHRSTWDTFRVEAWAGVDNLADKTQAGSVIVNQAARQYFEPGLPRNWMTGVRLSVPL